MVLAENAPVCGAGFCDTGGDGGVSLASEKTPVRTGAGGATCRGASRTGTAATGSGNPEAGARTVGGRSGSGCGLGAWIESRGGVVSAGGGAAILGKATVCRGSGTGGSGSGANKGVMMRLACRMLSGAATLKISTATSAWARTLASQGDLRTGTCWPAAEVRKMSPDTSEICGSTA